MVWNNSEIRGITINDKTAVISQYADDATFFVKDSYALEHLLDLPEFFSTLSGLIINLQKSHLLLLGNHKDPPSSIRGIRTADKVKILGMVYKAHMMEDEHFSLNFETRILKIKKNCRAWINRVFPLMLSILQYPSSCSYTPTRVGIEVKKIVTIHYRDYPLPV